MSPHSPVGSLWRRWDLHVHTPASYQWSGTPRLRNMTDAERRTTLTRIIEEWNSTQIGVFAVVDYWTFDGYLALRDLMSGGDAPQLQSTLLPGIELRIQSAGERRLNIQVLFHEDTPPHKLDDFLRRLQTEPNGGPPPTWEHARDAARQLSKDQLRAHGVSPQELVDDSVAAVVGYKTITVTQDSFVAALKPLRDEERCFVVLPYDTSDALADQVSWEHHPHEHRWFLNQADAFETRKQASIDVLLGRATDANARFIAQAFAQHGSRPRMAVAGSDAHRIEDYGVFPANNACWIKADPCFAGLLQARSDPVSRCHLGAEPPKLALVRANQTKYLAAAAIRKTSASAMKEAWFDAQLELNPGFVAIIGNRGSGKTALADIVALLGNTHRSDFEFLSKERFRQPPENKATHFAATVTWRDGHEESLSLSDDPSPDKPERVKYLPQSHIEKLCASLASGRGSDFERELAQVVFGHIPHADRIGAESVDDLLRMKAVAPLQRMEVTRREISTLHRTIIAAQRELSTTNRTRLEAQLAEAKRRLAAHDAQRPPEEPQPEATSPAAEATAIALAELRAALSGIETDIKAADESMGESQRALNVLERLEARLKGIETEVGRTLALIATDAAAVGLDAERLLTFAIHVESIHELRAKLAETLRATRVKLDGKEPLGLRGRKAEVEERIAEQQRALDEPALRHQTYLTQFAAWEAQRQTIVGDTSAPGSVAFIEQRIAGLSDVVPTKLAEAVERRNSSFAELFDAVNELRKIRQDLYAPVARQLDGEAVIAKEMGLEFEAGMSCVNFEEEFLRHVAQNKKGAFYGKDEARRVLRELVAAHRFDSLAAVQAFIGAIFARLGYASDQSDAVAGLAAQLRDQERVGELLDFVYSIAYVRPYFSMKLKGKELALLSPGERGALLIVFYLLLDPSDVPLIIDQPEHNLDNETVFNYLVPCFKRARERRQVIVVTHNPNLAVVADAEQIIVADFDRANNSTLTYSSGAVENPAIAKRVVDILEGTMPAFRNRDERYRTSGVSANVGYPPPPPESTGPRLDA